MARIREKLRHGGAPSAVVTLPVPVLDEERVEAVGGTEQASEAMSFVEVGPQRYFEASADVLAAGPVRSVLPGPHAAMLRALTPAAPKRELASELVTFHTPDQPASARYRDLLTSLLEAGRVRASVACRTLLVTAARSEIGTTTVLLNLAISAARQDMRVIVVDSNLRRPAIADRLALPSGPGLTDVLAGEIALADAVQTTAQHNLFALAAGSASALLADESSLRDVVEGLAEEFDLVLLDGPRIEQPLPAAGRAWDRSALALLATACEAMYLVVPTAESESADTTEFAASLASRGLPLAGCIVTV